MAPRLGLRRALAPFLLLGASLIVTLVAAKSAARAADTQDRLRFENAADSVRSAIVGRLDAYTAMLRGGAGLFAASQEVTFSEFHAYVERLELPLRYPGIQGMGFSRLVRADERDRIAEIVRRTVPSFHYWPPPQPNADIHAIVFLEPQDERNKVAMGYDMWSEPVRRDAMMLARDTATPAASGRVRLVQEIDPREEQAGFLIYVPVYHGGLIPQRDEDRRRLLLGFVYGPFRVDDLLSGVLGPEEARAVGFEVYDGTPRDDRLMYQFETGARGRFETVRPIRVSGRPWTLVLHSTAEATGSPARTITLLIGAGGTLLSILLFLVMRTQVRARQSAEAIADELRRSEEALRKANDEKDEFLAIISHELRTPLNAIVGWAVMLRRGQVPPEGFVHALEVIERNAAAQATLVEDLLDISRAVAGRLRLDKSIVEVTPTLLASVDAVKPPADARGVAVIAEVPDNLGTIYADPARLQQIVLNLLSNGIKFTPSGGRVTLTAERLTDALVIRVSDNGIGIDQAFLPHVFERFRQADTSTTRSHTGVGLGLAIARHLVTLHGGSIAVNSPGSGLGSTFTVRLPFENV